MRRSYDRIPRPTASALLLTIILLTITLLFDGCGARTLSAATIGSNTRRLVSRPFFSKKPSSQELSPARLQALLDVRGGASKAQQQQQRTKARKKTGGRTATLSSSSSSSQKTATGKKKVGSAAAAEKEKQSAFSDTLQKYKKILPLTRIYITLVVLATFLGLVLGEELTQTVLALDPMRVLYGFQLWRPITAACFLGPPSISWLLNGYYLFQYGSSLERAYGTAQHLIFLLTQVIVLSIFSILTGQPFFASSMITAMLHVLSRAMPHQKVKWLVFTVPYWSLPYGLMVTDVLQSQSAMAALPHFLGILSGHFYHFYKFIWPKVGDAGPDGDWLVAPDFVRNRLDPDARQANTNSKDSVNKALKSRKRKKGRKLSG